VKLLATVAKYIGISDVVLRKHRKNFQSERFLLMNLGTS